MYRTFLFKGIDHNFSPMQVLFLVYVLRSNQITYSLYASNLVVPRKGYKSITVSDETCDKFVKAVQEAKKVDPIMTNSKFIDLLLGRHKKSK